MTSGPRTESATVIGGGLIGLCCAYYLRQAGLHVTVVERHRVGSGASRGNAGEICPDLVTPLPAPGVIGPALRGLPRRDSALHLRPRLDAALVRFLIRFGRNSTRRRHSAGVRALSQLAAGSFRLFEEMESAGVDAEPVKRGYVFAYASADSARRALGGFREVGAPLGSDVLEGAELTELEPALGPRARAGILIEDQWSVDPSLFVDRLAGTLREQGVDIIEGARVSSLAEAGGRTRVRTSLGDFISDTAVIAAGVWSRELCRGLGVDIDLFPGKGYSFSVEADPMPRRVIHLGDARVVCTPMGERLRVAGSMEFDSNADAFHPRRVEAVVAAAGGYLRSADWSGRQDEWVGARVMTPDGLPAVGLVPGHSRIHLASGHNMLGLMLGPATGRLIADLLSPGPAPAVSGLLSPGRSAIRV
ncbi:FAD-binding oxidoreductase [Streptomyces sp. WMMB 322]|uniref:NAD(P)/FAD-dependent oxidoreductase n=1 Tax=Streptomyces sp. WMMB 322 TaxID=1286821 RepID=UPI000945632B|nr:FAD-dependent oxidoreductase [Streptomyces sp. WMMB 322]